MYFVYVCVCMCISIDVYMYVRACVCACVCGQHKAVSRPIGPAPPLQCSPCIIRIVDVASPPPHTPLT